MDERKPASPEHAPSPFFARGGGRALGALGFVALACAWTARAWTPDGGTPLLAAASAGDISGTIWTYAHAMRALSGGPLLDAPGAFAPMGLRHVAMYDLGDALLAAPLMAVAGVRVGYNLSVALLLTLNMLAGRALARASGADGVAAWAAGAWLGAATYVQRELGEGRPSQALLAPMAFALAGTLRLAKGEATGRIVAWTGVCAAWTALTYWYYGAFLLGMGALVVGTHARTRAAWRGILGAAVVGGLLVAPAVAALLGDYEALPGVARPLPHGAAASALDRGEFGLYNAIRVSNTPGFVFARGDNPTANPVAWTVLALTLFSFVRARTDRTRAIVPWLAMGVAGWALSLGPWLTLGSHTVPMPFLWLYDHVPAFDRFWWPQRCEAMLVVGTIPLFTNGLMWVATTHRAVHIAVPLAVCVESVMYLKWGVLPVHAAPRVRTELYETLNGALLTVPVMSDSDTGRHLLWLQAHHGHPVLAGLGENIPEHRPDGYTSFVRGNPLLDALHRVDGGEGVSTTVTPADIEVLIAAGFRWAVVDPSVFDPDTANVWANTYASAFGALWGAPDRLEDGAAAWRIRPLPAEKHLNIAYSGDPRPLRVARPW